jgi:hypothetical protein
MSFGLSMRGVSRVTSYAEAVALYERAPETRSGERRIPGRARSAITGINMWRGEVTFRYHRTDVVTWKPDGSCVLDLRYSSQSTATFANSFAPWGIHVLGEAKVIAVGPRSETRYYRAGSHVTITPDGEIEGTRAFRVLTPNRKRAKQARVDTGFEPFAAWYKLQASFWQGNLHRGGRHRYPDDLIAALRDPEEWQDILSETTLGFTPGPERFLAKLRAYIYEKADVYDVVEEPYAPSYNTARKWLRG